MAEFLHMGGYAAYVWGAYAVAFVVLLINILLPRQAEQRLLTELADELDSPPNNAS